MYAPSVDGNYFFYGGQYYVFANGDWYVGPTYNGPWAAVAPAYIPLPLLRVPVRYYRTPPPHWKDWRREAAPRWDPTWGHEWKKANKEDEKEWRKADKEDQKGWRKADKEDEKERKELEKEARKEHKK